jgi:hypothetical protein
VTEDRLGGQLDEPAPYDLLDQVLVLAGGAILERHEQGPGKVVAQLRHGDTVLDLSADLFDVLTGLTGVPVRQVLDAFMTSRGLPAGGRPGVEGQLVEVLRQLSDAALLTRRPPTAHATSRWHDVAEAPADQVALSQAGASFRRLGYTSAGLRQMLGGPNSGELDISDAELTARRLAAGEQAGTQPPALLLARLFLLEDTVREEHVRAVLAEGDLAVLLATGLLRPAGDGLRAGARVLPHLVPGQADLLLAFDGSSAEQRQDMVPAPHRPSLTLAQFTPRQHVGSALDVGTGLGVQALLMSRHADRVVATDVNRRAVGFAALNAGLNDVRLDLRHGSLLDPVGDETFDLLVSNPPYVLSPETSHVFRDSGYPGDSFNRLVAGTFGSALAPGGTGVVLLSWAQPPARNEPVPLDWVADPELDALLVWTGLASALDEAASWNREYDQDYVTYGRNIDAWLRWYRRYGIEQIGYGALALRRRGAAVGASSVPWRLALSGERSGAAAGDQLDRILSAHGQMADVDDAALLDARVALQPDVHIRAEHRRSGGRWSRSAEVVLENGLGLPMPLADEQERALLVLGDADVVSARQLLPIFSARPDPVADACRFLRGLIEAGLAVLEP